VVANADYLSGYVSKRALECKVTRGTSSALTGTAERERAKVTIGWEAEGPLRR